MRRLLKIMKSGLVGEIWEYLEIDEHPEDWTLRKVRRHFDGIIYFLENCQINLFILAVLQAQLPFGNILWYKGCLDLNLGAHFCLFHSGTMHSIA